MEYNVYKQCWMFKATKWQRAASSVASALCSKKRPEKPRNDCDCSAILQWKTGGRKKAAEGAGIPGSVKRTGDGQLVQSRQEGQGVEAHGDRRLDRFHAL